MLTSTPAALQAQEPLEHLWNRLESVESLEALAMLDVPPAADRAIADALLRLRRYELGRDRTDALIARSKLERLAPTSQSAWVHFALGVTLARGPDVRIVPGTQPERYFVSAQSNAAKRAPRALRRALELAPTLHDAAYTLAELALDLGDRPLMGEALEALAHPSRSRAPRVLALRSQILAMLNELGGAEQAAAALRDAGGDASVASYLAAAALLRQPDREVEGARAYFDGVATLSPASADLYFDAVAAAASPGELQRWEAADMAGRRDWLRRFWRVHAALAGVPVEQRLAEHYRRLAVVMRDGRTAPMGAGGAGGGITSDVRGLGITDFGELLLLRHGDPLRADRVRFCGKEVLDMPLALAPTPHQCAVTALSRGREKNAAYVGGTRLVIARAARRAAPGTTWYPPFRRHIDIVHELLQFRGAAGQTTLVASAGLATEDAADFVREGVLTARMELAIIDTAAADVVRHDSDRSFRVAQLPAGGWVLLASELALSPRSAQLYRLGVMDAGRTTGRVVGGTIDVRSYDTGELMLSDVLLTPQDGTPSFTRGDVRLSLAPGREFRTDEQFTLYYEIYGLARDAVYRTDIEVRPRLEGIGDRLRQLLPGARESLRLSFTETAAAVHAIHGVQQTRSVGLDGILPGSYTVRISVTDAAGNVATRERALDVVTK